MRHVEVVAFPGDLHDGDGRGGSSAVLLRGRLRIGVYVREGDVFLCCYVYVRAEAG